MKLNDILKKGFNPTPEEWDKEDLWMEIEKSLPPKEKKRRFIIWWFAGFLMFLTIIIIGELLYENQRDHQDLSKVNKIESKKINKDISLDKAQKKYTQSNEFNEESYNNPNVSENNTLNSLEDGVIKDIHKSTEATIYQNNERDQLLQITLSEDYIPKSNLNSDITLNSVKHNIQTLNDSIFKNEKVFVERSIDFDSTYLKEVEKLTMLKSVSPISSIPLVQCFVFGMSETYELNRLLIQEEVVNRRSSKAFAINFGLSYLVPKSSISSIDQERINFISLHRMSRQVLEGLSLDLMLSKNISPKMKLGLGIQVNRIAENYFGEITTQDTMTVYSDSAAVYTVNGVSQYFSGYKTRIETSTRFYKTPISRWYLNVPIRVSYAFRLGRFSLDPYLQMNVNLLHRYVGKSYDLELNLIENENPEFESLYKRSLVNSFETGLAIHRPIGKRIAMGLGIRYLRQYASSFKRENQIIETYEALGFKIELGYLIN